MISKMAAKMDTKLEHLPNPYTCEDSQLDVCIYQLWYDYYEVLKSNAKIMQHFIAVTWEILLWNPWRIGTA